MEKLLDKELEVVNEIGFKNKEEFIEEAVNTYLAARKDIRISLAAALYNEEKISLGRAVELSGLNIEEFKEYLNKKGIKRKTSPSENGKKTALAYRKL